MADKVFESNIQSSLEEEGTAVDAASKTELNDEAQEADFVETSIQVQVLKRENPSMAEVCIFTSPLKGETEPETLTLANHF